jgi:hypothetical protein
MIYEANKAGIEESSRENEELSTNMPQCKSAVLNEL